MLKNKSEMNKIKRYLKNLRNSLDNSDMIGYINSMFRLETYRKSFGLTDSYRKLLESQKQRDRKEGITGGSTVTGGTSGGY